MFCSTIATSGEVPSARSFHAAVVIGEFLYIHGGVDKSNRVLSSLHCYNVTSKAWVSVETMPSCPQKASNLLPALEVCDAPSLCHHCALNYNDKFILLIGGWNGRKRTSDVYVFDTCENGWNKAKICGDIPVGLSSHTAINVNENEILIVGREGGVRTQRRSGDAFSLNPKTGEYKSAVYFVDSRSGHVCCLVRCSRVKGYRMLVYSGRKTGIQCSFIGSWHSVLIKENKVHEDLSGKVTALIKRSKRIETPKGRQHSKHFCIDDRLVFIYGGQLWQARESVTSDIIVLDTEENSWYKLEGDSSVPNLTGFTLNVGIDGQCYVFGGSDGRASNNNLWNLQAIG